MMAGCAIRPLPGETHCGDACRWWPDDASWVLCAADGLGHGPEAEIAAQAALSAAEGCRGEPPAGMLKIIDRQLKGTRGAACAAVRVSRSPRLLSYAAVGNIRGALFGIAAHYLDAMPGIAGAGIREPASIQLPWMPGDLLAIWTDGLSAGLTLDPQLRRLMGAPEQLAQRLLEVFGSQRDDALVLCCYLDDASP